MYHALLIEIPNSCSLYVNKLNQLYTWSYKTYLYRCIERVMILLQKDL